MGIKKKMTAWHCWQEISLIQGFWQMKPNMRSKKNPIE